ncbi:CHASE2 domain-containing protein [Gloeothece citriformis]|nr:CHASE2 domain-containing protein [Gloeothece citriformis]
MFFRNIKQKIEENREKIIFNLIKVALGLSIIWGIGEIRNRGSLQWFEWVNLDIFFQLRPSEPIDNRIILVGQTEDDIKNMKSAYLSDRQVAQLIKIIKEGKPVAIGLDFLRDQPIGEGREELLAIFNNTPTLYGVGKQAGIEGDPDFAPIAPPPIKFEQITEASALEDGDSVVRRQLLYPKTTPPAIPNLGLALAFTYLEKQKGIKPEAGEKKALKLGKATFFLFSNPSGPYTQADDGGYQIFFNWRKIKFHVVSVSDVLAQKNISGLFDNRIVIIGSYAASKKDQFLTPFSRTLSDSPREMFGMEIQAQLASAIISQVLDERPVTLAFWTEPWISAWLIGWGIVICFILTFFSRNWIQIAIFLLGSSVLLIILSYFLFLEAIWFPLIPSLMILWSLGIVLAGLDYEFKKILDNRKIRQLNENLIELNQQLKDKLDRRQAYKEFTVLGNQFSKNLNKELQNLFDLKFILLEKKTNFKQILQKNINDSKNFLELNNTWLETEIATDKVFDSFEAICLKLINHFPRLENLFSNYDWLSDENWEYLTIEETIKLAIKWFHPIYFHEYNVELDKIIKLDFQSEYSNLQKVNSTRFIIVFNRIIDTIFLKVQTGEISYPKNQAEKISYPTITIKTVYKNKLKLIFTVQYLIETTFYNIFFCQELLDYYKAKLTIKQDKEKGLTNWIIDWNDWQSRDQ